MILFLDILNILKQLWILIINGISQWSRGNHALLYLSAWPITEYSTLWNQDYEKKLKKFFFAAITVFPQSIKE